MNFEFQYGQKQAMTTIYKRITSRKAVIKEVLHLKLFYNSFKLTFAQNKLVNCAFRFTNFY